MSASTPGPPSPAPASGLVRGIRRWDLFLLMINSTIGAGIFGLPAKVYALIGPWSLPAIVACGAVVALVILCFAEVASRFERTGGPYLYARAAFGALVGFEVGWLLWLVRLTSYAALSNLLVAYLAVLWPGADTPSWRIAVISGVTAVFATINLLGVRNAALTGNVMTIAKLVPLVLLIVVGLGAVNPAPLALGPAPESGGFAKALLLLVFAFTGFELAIIPAGETRDPRRDLPWALLSGLGCVAVFYLLIQIVCIGTVPALAGSERPLADAATHVLGPWGGTLIAAGALVSISGTLGAILLAAPRLPFAMAEGGGLPRVLATTHPRFHTPWAAILVTSVLTLALSLSTSFLGALTIGTIIRLVTFVLTCVAMLVLRRRRDVPEATFRAPLGVVTATLALLACGWLLTSITGREAGIATLAALLGLLIYGIGRWAARPGR
jgi:amino acid transporter